MTHDQRIASDPDISVWVSANAGTGKTKVLTDRVLRILLAGCRPDKILCITYTKAAAAEMEHRIETQLSAWAITDDDGLRQSLSELTGQAPDEDTIRKARQLFARVIDAPQRIRIQTIHSFCQSVLKRFPLEAGISPHFILIDEHTSAELLKEAQAQLFSESGTNGCGAAIEALAGMLSEQAFSDLIAGIITHLAKFTRWLERPAGTEELIKKVYETAEIPTDITQDSIFARHFRYTNTELQALQQACAALAKSSATTDIKICEALQAWLESPPETGKAKSYFSAFLTGNNEPRKYLSTKDAENFMSGLKDLLRAEQERIAAYTSELCSLHMAQATGHMIHIAHALLAIYRNLKDSHGYLDYNDVIAYTVKLLSRSGATAWILYKLDNGIDHLLVDEAQDTSPEQWELVEILSSEFFSGMGARTVNRSLFVVGDSKQSIFSFQGADPYSFGIMQSRLRKRILAAEKEFRNVQLALSFRSTEPVLQTVDDVFASATARDGLLFLENAIRHEAHRKGMAGRVEIWPLTETDAPDEMDDGWHVAIQQAVPAKPETVLARKIATQIRGWIDSKRLIPSQARTVQPGDIIILVQRRGTFASAMTHALKQNDIPVAGTDRLILTDHIAIEDCIALAHFLLLPQDDMTLATVLKSPFIGLSEEALFELAYDRKDLSLWERIKEIPKYAWVHDYLADLLAHVDYLPPYELFSYIMETRGGRKKLAARLGAEIDDPLNEFLSLAIRYSEIDAPSLQGFLHWVQSGETEIKRDMEKARNEVRIMTAHGAKGLQAPIVFLPDTTRMPLHDNGILWTRDAEPIPLWGASDSCRDTHYHNLKEMIQMEREREYRRLLYVAMTRAEDELYICGWKGKRAVSPRCWYELVRQGVSDRWQSVDGMMALISEQSVPAKKKTAIVKPFVDITLPDWINKPPPPEQAGAMPLAPSSIGGSVPPASPLQDQTARMRGVLIHRLLQYIPEVEPPQRKAAIQRFISRYGSDFSKDAQDTIRREVMAILERPDFTPIFSADSVAEVPVSGIITDSEGKKTVISGQIDRLCVLDKKVYIIDYKTGNNVPETPQDIPLPYLNQIMTYRQLTSEIYPDKIIYCGLLWTAVPRLMFID